MQKPEERDAGRDLLGGVLAGLAGWGAGAVCLTLWCVVMVAEGNIWEKLLCLLFSPFFFLLITLPMNFVAWGVIFMPLYVALPRRSVLWKPLPGTILGASEGFVVALTTGGNDWYPYPIPLMSAIAGAVMAFTATQTVRHFRGEVTK